MNVSIVIPTYNRAPSLRHTLEALREQRVPPEISWELIVVDNNSSDETRAVVEALRPSFPAPLLYLFEPRQGVSSARNAGIDQAKGAAVSFTDDDVIPAPDWVATVHHARDRLGADVIGGRILPRWPGPVPEWLEGSVCLYDRLALMTHDSVAKITLATDKPRIWGANMTFRRSVFDAGHRFDPKRGAVGDKLYRGEESYLIRELLAMGHTVVFDPEIVVWHRIQPERMRAGYFRRQSFQAGEGEGRLAGRIGRSLLGAPLFYYRWTALTLAQWLAAVARRRGDAFECELDFLMAAGRLWGCWRRYFDSRNEASA